ncbi:hypothetical protein Tco_0710049 [Tanacetum coccineum]
MKTLPSSVSQRKSNETKIVSSSSKPKIVESRSYRSSFGEDSFEEMPMTSTLGIFLGGFLVKELALEAMKMMIKESTPLLLLPKVGKEMTKALEHSLDLLEFWGFSSFDGWKLIDVGDRIKRVVIHRIIFVRIIKVSNMIL